MLSQCCTYVRRDRKCRVTDVLLECLVNAVLTFAVTENAIVLNSYAGQNYVRRTRSLLSVHAGAGARSFLTRRSDISSPVGHFTVLPILTAGSCTN